MASTTMKRMASLPLKVIDGDLVVENFGWFIDTHRDMPHIGTFEDDLHRGMCKPTKVHYVPDPAGGPGFIQHTVTGKRLELHSKHQFVTDEWMGQFIVSHMLRHGTSPFEAKTGEMPTSLLRDPRAKIYHLKSFRQMVVYHQSKT